MGGLARSYISLVQDLEKYVASLQSVMAEKERINAELSLASDIQAHMLPSIFPPFPDHNEFGLYAIMHPAKEVGGDFYDFFMIGEDRLAVIVADVSGKGVPAALFMVIAKALIKNYAQTKMEPAEVFTTVNRLLCDGNDADLFVTAWMGVLELSTGTLTYVNAGHNPPLIKRNGGGFDYLRERSGFVLGGMDCTRYHQNTLTIAPGDRLFLYTDGVTETTDTRQQLYGEDRLQAFLNASASCNAAEMLHRLQHELQEFAGSAPQFDDITMLLLDFKGNSERRERMECGKVSTEAVHDYGNTTSAGTVGMKFQRRWVFRCGRLTRYGNRRSMRLCRCMRSPGLFLMTRKNNSSVYITGFENLKRETSFKIMPPRYPRRHCIARRAVVQ